MWVSRLRNVNDVNVVMLQNCLVVNVVNVVKVMDVIRFRLKGKEW